MKRRAFMALLGGAAAAWPLAVQAQQPAKMLRVGALSAQPRAAPIWLAFEQRMAELGHKQGTNFSFEFVQVTNIGDYEGGYRELAARNVDIMLATGPENTLKSARAAAPTLPIVMLAIDYDPIASGHVTSLSRPTGNVTGMHVQQIELAEKRVQILRDAFPDLSSAITFWDELSADQWHSTQTAAATLGFPLAGVKLHDPPYDYEHALAQFGPNHRSCLMVMVSAFFFRDRAILAELALRHRIVSMFGFREWAEAGGLLSYGPNIIDMHRRIADYVDRIAKGTKTADLPIEQPSKFEFVVNLKTAKAIGIEMPTSILLRADKVIE
jgi:putative tryptophan/tyrosine transport system substrate-binding protein